MTDIWQKSEGKHKWRAKPYDFRWWRLSKAQPRIKFNYRKSWHNLISYHFDRKANQQDKIELSKRVAESVVIDFIFVKLSGKGE
jgi:hypothetical protein